MIITSMNEAYTGSTTNSIPYTITDFLEECGQMNLDIVQYENSMFNIFVKHDMSEIYGSIYENDGDGYVNEGVVEAFKGALSRIGAMLKTLWKFITETLAHVRDIIVKKYRKIKAFFAGKFMKKTAEKDAETQAGTSEEKPVSGTKALSSNSTSGTRAAIADKSSASPSSLVPATATQKAEKPAATAEAPAKGKDVVLRYFNSAERMDPILSGVDEIYEDSFSALASLTANMKKGGDSIGDQTKNDQKIYQSARKGKLADLGKAKSYIEAKKADVIKEYGGKNITQALFYFYTTTRTYANGKFNTDDKSNEVVVRDIINSTDKANSAVERMVKAENKLRKFVNEARKKVEEFDGVVKNIKGKETAKGMGQTLSQFSGIVSLISSETTTVFNAHYKAIDMGLNASVRAFKAARTLQGYKVQVPDDLSSAA